MWYKTIKYEDVTHTKHHRFVADGFQVRHWHGLW